MSKKINLFITSLRGGGAERVCVTIANGFASKGFKVNLIVLNLFDSVYHNDLNQEVDLINLNRGHVRTSIVALAKYILKERPRFVIAFNPQISIILILLRFLFGIKYTLISRNINTLSKMRENQKSFWHKYIVDYFIKKLYFKSDLIIAQSYGMKEDLINNYNINRNKIKVIYNPVSEKILEKQEYTQKNNIKNNEILFVGRLSKQKGLNYLFKAFALCVKSRSDLKLRILGEGPLKPELQLLAKELKIYDNVIFEGFKDDVAYYYENSALTVMSSLYEGFPNVLVESITLGTPVVSFDCPSGPKEIINNGINGYLVEYKNIHLLSESILKALEKKWNTIEVVNTAKKYRADVILEQYISLFKESD